MQTAITLPSYTISIRQKNSQHFLLTISHPGRQVAYSQSVHRHQEKCQQVFQNFETLHDFLDHLKNPQNSSFSFQTSELIIYTTGILGKNRKYFELFRLKFQQQIMIRQIIQMCEKQDYLSQAQVKNFICSLARKIEQKAKQFRSQGQNQNQINVSSQLAKKIERETATIMKANQKFRQSLKESFEQCRGEIYKILEQKLFEFEVSLAQSISQIKQKYQEEISGVRILIPADRKKIGKKQLSTIDELAFKKDIQKQNEKIKIEEKRQDKKMLSIPQQKQRTECKKIYLIGQYYRDITKQLKSADRQATHIKLQTQMMQLKQLYILFYQVYYYTNQVVKKFLTQYVNNDRLSVAQNQLRTQDKINKAVNLEQFRAQVVTDSVCKLSMTQPGNIELTQLQIMIDPGQQNKSYEESKFICDKVSQFGEIISSFKSLIEFDLSFNYDLYDDPCWDNLVNYLNGLATLKNAVIRVQKGNKVRRQNWTERLKKKIDVRIIKE